MRLQKSPQTCLHMKLHLRLLADKLAMIYLIATASHTMCPEMCPVFVQQTGTTAIKRNLKLSGAQILHFEITISDYRREQFPQRTHVVKWAPVLELFVAMV